MNPDILTPGPVLLCLCFGLTQVGPEALLVRGETCDSQPDLPLSSGLGCHCSTEEQTECLSLFSPSCRIYCVALQQNGGPRLSKVKSGSSLRQELICFKANIASGGAQGPPLFPSGPEAVIFELAALCWSYIQVSAIPVFRTTVSWFVQ